MPKTFRPYLPNQLLLLPQSVQDWVPRGDLAHFISDVVDVLDLSAIEDVYEEEGRPLWLGRLNLEGDAQADLKVHDGPDRAVHVHPSEHYQSWRVELSWPELAYADFGESFISFGQTESTVFIGDVFRVG